MSDVVDQVLPQITHFGLRPGAKETDLIVGFRCFGPVTEDHIVRLHWTRRGQLPMEVVGLLWTPSLGTFKGFETHGPHGPRPFVLPDEFEIVEFELLRGSHTIVHLQPEIIYLVCGTIPGCITDITLMAEAQE